MTQTTIQPPPQRDVPAAREAPPTIEAVPFVPSGEADRGSLIKPWQAALMVLGVLAAGIFWFLFTSKSVQLKFTPAAESVSVSGGLSFELGGVYLLREGTYQVQAEAELYEPLQMALAVTGERNQTHAFAFTPRPGFLSLSVQPADAAVTIDGQAQSSLDAIELPAGEHELTVTHPRYLPTSEIITIEGLLKTQNRSVALAPNWADVSVDSTPAGAEIYIDDELWPARTPTIIEALAGEREIRVNLEGHKAHRERIFAQAGTEFALQPIRLEQADAQLALSSTPGGAGVIVGGNFIGRTPLTVDLKSGVTHRVQIVRGGYESVDRTLRLARGEQSSLNINLARLTGEVVVVVEPAAAQLTVNGRARGAANQTLTLPVEAHQLAVTLDGYAAFSQKITPKPGLTQEIKVRLLTLEEARLAALTPSITAPDGQTLLLFEPFDFRMGASRREPGRRANEALREVKMERLVYLGTREVTNAQFRQFATGHDSGKYVETTLNEDDQPVVNLSWHDAAAYCNWLSDQQGLAPFYEIEFGKVIGTNPGAIGYRLPTEAEWAWAARTLDSDREKLLRFPWGANLPPEDRHGNYADRAGRPLVGRVIFGYNDNYAASAPVGTFRANHRQLYDLGGNVAEWVHDFYALGGPENAGTDPLGPVNGEYRVIRGSSWMHGTITELRLSFRDYGIDGREDVGFRVARYAE